MAKLSFKPIPVTSRTTILVLRPTLSRPWSLLRQGQSDTVDLGNFSSFKQEIFQVYDYEKVMFERSNMQ
jgi:hypothetical protein